MFDACQPPNGQRPYALPNGEIETIEELLWGRAEGYRSLNPSLMGSHEVTLADRGMQLAAEGARSSLQDLISRLGLRGLTWEKITEAFNHCDKLLADRHSKEEIEREDSLPTVTLPLWKNLSRKGRLNFISQCMAKTVRRWLARFTKDGAQVHLGFDIEDLIRRLVRIPDDDRFTCRETTLLCVSALRYPHPENPYLQVSRLRLFVWAHFNGTKTTPVDWGIKGAYNSLNYRLRDKVFRSMASEPQRTDGQEPRDLINDSAWTS